MIKEVASDSFGPALPGGCIFTFDLEEWFCSHSEEAPEIGGYAAWPNHEMRAHLVVPRLLDILDEAGVTATFFVLGWYAERQPGIVREIHSRGHRIGCHTYSHRHLFRFDYRQFREDLLRARNILEDFTGQPVLSFRAPSFSIRKDNLWVLETLVEAGFRYDSSLFPTARFDGGLPGCPACPTRIETPSGDMLEFPISVVKFTNKLIPLTGGGYFRLSPNALVRRGLSCMGKYNVPVLFYFHPFDFDGDQPVYPYRPLNRFRKFVRRKSLFERVQALLASQHWIVLEDYLDKAVFGNDALSFENLSMYPMKTSQY